MIEIIDLCKSLDGKVVLDHLNLTVEKGQTYVIIGRSGTGKSVTLKNITGLLAPDSGQIIIMDKEIGALTAKEFYGLKEKMGVVFQSGALINWLSVGENVALPLKEHKRKLKPKEIKEIVREKLALVELHNVEDRMPSEISGGMKKRVGLARAIVHNPDIVLFDEPTSGLDPVMSNQINELILSLQEKLDITSICVTHDMESAYCIGNKIGMLYQGKIIEEGRAQDIQNTSNEIVRQFIEGRTKGPLTEGWSTG